MKEKYKNSVYPSEISGYAYGYDALETTYSMRMRKKLPNTTYHRNENLIFENFVKKELDES